MNTLHRHCVVVLSAAVMLSQSAAASPEGSLTSCQKTVKTAASKFVSSKIKAVESCLAKISKELIGKNAPDASGAAKTCVSSFRKLENAADPTKTLKAKMLAKIEKSCDPSMNPDLEHTLPDVLGPGATVPRPINADNLNDWCTHFGGDGKLDSVQEWVDCITAASECAVDIAVSTHFPSALQWFDDVRPFMAALNPPPTDALSALDAVNNTIEGSIDDDMPGFRCGTSLFPVSGQTTSYTPGDDGDLKAGAPFDYVDHGDGTLTDVNTGLMWEKKGDNGGLHDKDVIKSWIPGVGSIWEWIGQVNAEGGTGFAGHNDWRIPNIKELQSIFNYEFAGPAVSAAFNMGCMALCNATTCSCTGSAGYWSSTTYAAGSTNAWQASFLTGVVNIDNKGVNYLVRAVRGGG